METFTIYHTFDIDQDFNPLSDDYYNRDGAHFNGFSEAMPLIIKALEGRDFSVFLRADYQIKKVYGSYGYLLEEYPDTVSRIIKSGGELNWHIHLYEEHQGSWKQIETSELLCKRFKEDYEYVSKIDNINTKIVRVGECVMDNKLMHLMNGLCIDIDSTALPQRKRDDAQKHFDWSTTTNTFYYPSIKDYRVSSTENVNLLEVPMTTVKMQASYDDEAYYRYINMSFKSDVLFQNMQEFILKNATLLTITHPFEILQKGSHPLISYDISTLEENIKRLDEMVRACGKVPVYKKISDLLG